MAKKVSENDIQNMSQDWGLDTSNNLPYSGAAVQKFIKGTLESKMGYFYYDPTSNRYLCFANEESKNKYLDDPTQTSLVLGAFDAPFNYEASITLLTPTYNAVFLGGKGNYLDFTFDIKNKSGNSTGENVNVTYTFIRNATKRVITETRKYGESVHVNIDEYLLEGTNTVIIGIQGQTSLAATTASITYQVVNLSFSDEVNIAKVYDLSNGNQTVEVFFNVSGYGTKIVEWFLDGVQLPFVKSEDEVIDVTSSRTKYIELSNLSSGIHTLQYRAYTVINGEKFYTDTLYREVMVTTGDADNMVSVATTLPNSHGLVTSENPLTLYGAEQYIPYTIRFATRKSGEVTISLDKEVLATLLSSSGIESSYQIVSSKSGSLKMTLSANGVEREIPLSVNNTSLNIEEIKTSLVFDFSARGKSNASVDKDSWSYGNYNGTFNGFNWNASSGWVNNALLVNSGASFSVDIAPLMSDATATGKTLEFEFSTRNVEDDNAVVCDLTTNGVGLLITASEARLTSVAGETVSTRFKSGEVNRIAFVINKKASVTYKGLAFIYVNGILSGAVNYGSADNFISQKTLAFQGTEDAQVELRSMRFYDTALSSDNILNNYVLYRDTLNEMMEVYYRNDIYEQGTSTFSTALMLHRLPVMVITGDIPTLESATSTSTQILVDIDYTNEQDPTKNFSMKRAALRIQGTSSLAYPRKNFRFYTTKEESTMVYDANGNAIADKLYSFVDGAQPVDCWCLKADYAESSGTHNTGIARIWNKVMYGAIIQHTNVLGEETNGYALRTQAQESALSADYKYDVRTTIDGFPIVLFYKQKESDTDLIFLGKYNFNNDKSTPSVFGFENIPNFDNSRMQCWETKDNGHPLGLFTDVSNFDADWAEAYESRYPDTKTPNTADLKAFSEWMNGVTQEDFVTQKWQHMDVYKVAAYYVYLMRFGAVDQTVKNGFLTSEDGEKFFFINYDNDTINGLINTGELRLQPTITRQTIGSDGEYVFAGHNSMLWNRCEADTEFMDIVSIVDNALYSAGLRYNEVMKVFNDEQCDKWAERVYNQDAEYKYLLPYVNQATNNLFMLQGSRSSHRAWWLSKRFSLYDSLFVSGAYRDRNISFKCLNDTKPNQQFTIKAGTDMNYGYGVNNGIRETGVALESGKSHTFTTTDTLNLGDVVKIFGASDLLELDLSQMISRLAVLDCSAASDNVLGSKLKTLILGGRVINTNTWVYYTNEELSSISGINKLGSLQNLNIQYYKNITTLDLTAQKDFRRLYAGNSGLASVDFAVGAPVEYLELPSTMIALNLQQLPYITSLNVVLDGGYANVKSMNIAGCPNLSNDFGFVKYWINSKRVPDDQCSLVMDNVDWMNIDVEDFIAFSQHKANGMSMDLRGKVYLSSLSLEQATQLQAIWGEDCFDKGVDFRITAPDALYINPDTAIIDEGNSLQFSCILFTSSEGSITYKIVSGNREGTSIDENTGLLTTTENGTSNATIYVRAIYTSVEGNTTYSTATVTIRKRVYPTSSSLSINGASTIGKDEVYTWATTAEDVNGEMTADWSVSGNAYTNDHVEVSASSLQSCTIRCIKAAEMGESVSGTLSLNLCKKSDGTVVATKTKTFTMAQLSYPTASNTTLSGESQPSDKNPVYTWKSTATGNIGPMSVVWSLDESLLPYFEIKSQEWNPENPLQGSCTLQSVMDVEFYMKGNINLTITYTNTGKSFTLSKELMFLSENVIMTNDTNPQALYALYNGGLCASNEYMTKAEAEAVTDGMFNPSGTQTGSIFNDSSITTFNELKYFTGLTQLDAYTFYNAKSLVELTIPENITKFKTYCCYVNSYVSRKINGDITVNEISNSAFDTKNTGISLNAVNFYATSSAGKAFNKAKIKLLNIYAISAGSSSTDGNTFCRSVINKMVISDSITSIPNYAFYGDPTISDLEIPDSVTKIGNYSFSGSITVTKISSNITSLGTTAFSSVTFNTDALFPKLTLSSDKCIKYGRYNNKLDFRGNTNSKIVLYQFFYNAYACNELWLSESFTTYDFGMNLQSSFTFQKLYIPNLQTFCSSVKMDTLQGSNYANNNLVAQPKEIYAKNINTDEYVLLNNFVASDWLVTEIYQRTFQGAKSITGYDGRGVLKHDKFVFYNSGIKTLKIDNANGVGTIASLAFGNCSDLVTIEDSSVQPWASLASDAFNGVNENVSINSQVFGLYKQSSGSTLGSLSNGVVSTLPFGEYTFNAPSGSAFAGQETSKTLTLGYTGHIEDLTDRLKIEYITLVISSNKENAQFNLSYTSASGEQTNETLGIGSHFINTTIGSTVAITPQSEFGGWDSPSATTVTMSSTTNSVTLDYTEKAEVFIAHKDGSLYTTDEWTASGNSNDDAEGVCVMRSESGGFIIAKTEASESNLAWGGYNKTISGIVTNTSSSTAVLDMDGIGNTQKIIEQCEGYTSSSITGAPAAEACAAYTFPSGQTGYLPALGEWGLAYDHKAAIVSAMTLIGGTAIKNNYYWSSTQYDSNISWLLRWNDGYLGNDYKYRSYPVRAFAAYGNLFISSTISTRFTVSYTNNYNELVIQQVGVGGTSLNIKVGTEITITPDVTTAEPKTFVWTGFRNDVNFVSAKDAGLYIQHVNGSLYTEEEWTNGGYSNSEANGVAVISTDMDSFVVAKEEASSSNLSWGGYGKEIQGVEIASSSSVAIARFNGFNNTSKIVEQLADYTDSKGITGAPAAEACLSYVFPNGKSGYLPELGELYHLYSNRTQLSNIFSLIGGTDFSQSYYWSSSIKDNNTAWRLYWKGGARSSMDRNEVFKVRAFCKL